MNLKPYIDSTYLKTAELAGLTEGENESIVKSFILEAIEEKFKAVMIRPDKVLLARTLVDQAKSKVKVGTVISFPNGDNSIEEKMEEANKAIEMGVDELDFVANYKAFIKGDISLVKNEILIGTRVGIQNHKIVKWIIEVAALNDKQIIQFSNLIKNIVISNFKEECYANVFIKSSTGFYKTENNMPNGATKESIVLMLENSTPLSVKASGGIRTYEEAKEMVQMGVKRIGTSSAKAILNGEANGEGY